MMSWLGHNVFAVAAVGLILAGILLVWIARRAWPPLLTLPAGLAALAWYRWEFSSETRPCAIAVFGYWPWPVLSLRGS
jgi:hypothetical protein